MTEEDFSIVHEYIPGREIFALPNGTIISPYANVLRQNLEQVKTDLLAWAGLHRGKAISEEAMPRFHEIIDRFEELLQ